MRVEFCLIIISSFEFSREGREGGKGGRETEGGRGRERETENEGERENRREIIVLSGP